MELAIFLDFKFSGTLAEKCTEFALEAKNAQADHIGLIALERVLLLYNSVQHNYQDEALGMILTAAEVDSLPFE